MFVLASTPAYWWPVPVAFPTDDGKVVSSTFDARFKRLPQDEHEALVAAIVARDTEATDSSIARQVLIGWRGVADPDGKTIEFSAEAVEQMLAIQGVATAVVKAYLGSIRKAAEKN